MNNENSSSSAPANTETTTIDTSTENTSQNTNSETQVLDQAKKDLKNPDLTSQEKKDLKKYINEIQLKVDGKNVTEKLPFQVDASNKEMIDYLTRQSQLAKMGHNRANYAKTLENEISEFFTNLKSDPLSVLSDPNLNIDLKNIVKEYARRELENSKKTPEQLKAEQLEAELSKLHKEREKEKEDFKKKEAERLQEKAYADYEQGIINAIESSPDLPKSTYVVRKFADMMLSALEMGVKVTPEEVLPLVKQEIHNDIKQMFEASPDEVVENFFGKERLTKLRKKNVDKAMSTTTAPLKQIKDVGKEEPKPTARQSYRQFFSK